MIAAWTCAGVFDFLVPIPYPENMAKVKMKAVFRCQQCGHEAPRWHGRCPECAHWNSFKEETSIPTAHRLGPGIRNPGTKPVPIGDLPSDVEQRILTGISEFDRVLGGGVVYGSVTLVGGDPGIGKTTLLLQMLPRLSQNGSAVLYVSGEESSTQIKMRGHRLGIDSPSLYLLAETSLEAIVQAAQELNPTALVVDSIQTTFSSQLTSTPGSISQVQEVTAQLMAFAKKRDIPVFIIGHVTKEGAIAGPRLLEHIVDTVLYFEGDRGHSYRILRAVKNRFGATNEIGVFEMTEAGLQEVPNPSALFLEDRSRESAGSVVVATMEGTRPILVEVQALVAPTHFANPKRVATGVDSNRVAILLAVIEKRLGLHLSGQDVYINVVGGIRIDETACDLGIVAAVISSIRERPIDAKTLVCGEIGLGGEIRAVSAADIRIREASKLGLKRCVLPEGNLSSLEHQPHMTLVGAKHIGEAQDTLFP